MSEFLRSAAQRLLAFALLAFALVSLLALPVSAGILTNQAELEDFKVKADDGVSPYPARRTSLINDATDPWANGTVSGVGVGVDGICSIGGNAEFLKEGAPDVLAMAAASLLTNNASQAASFRASAREHILDLTDTTFPTSPAGSYQCTLELAISLPTWIETAWLLAEIGAPWTGADTAAFQTWLASVYRHPAWASRVRRNNWGSAGSVTAYLIARYVESASPAITLVEVAPGPATITPADAQTQHNALQLQRIQTTEAMDSDCLIYGIQPAHGGIPDELRRGTTGCTGTFLDDDDDSLTYQTMHVEFLVWHARALWRRFDNSLWEAESQAILKAITFVIDNPGVDPDFAWDDNHYGPIFPAARYYSNAALTAAATSGGAFFRGGRNMPYMKVFTLEEHFNAAQCP